MVMKKLCKNDRVTMMHTGRWGTIQKVTNISLPGRRLKGNSKYMVEVLWDGAHKTDMVRGDFLIKDGEEILGKKFIDG